MNKNYIIKYNDSYEIDTRFNNEEMTKEWEALTPQMRYALEMLFVDELSHTIPLPKELIELLETAAKSKFILRLLSISLNITLEELIHMIVEMYPEAVKNPESIKKTDNFEAVGIALSQNQVFELIKHAESKGMQVNYKEEEPMKTSYAELSRLYKSKKGEKQ